MNEFPTQVFIFFPFCLIQNKQKHPPSFMFKLHSFVDALSDFSELDSNPNIYL